MNRTLRITAAMAAVAGLSYACGSSGTTAGTSNDSNETTTGLEGLEEPGLTGAQLTTLSGEQATLRLLLTDAPVDADNVFVTFCGVQVKAHGAAGSGTHDAAESRADAGSSLDAGSALARGNAADRVAAAEDADAGAAASDAGSGLGDGGTPAADAGRGVAETGGNSEGGQWLSLGDECQTWDLLALQNGVTREIGFETLPPGSYGQIRLMLREARIVVDGIEEPLTIPSGVESGIKINHGFELKAGSLTTLALDFDAARSIHQSGVGYIMRPVIELLGKRVDTYEDVSERDTTRREAYSEQDRPADRVVPGKSDAAAPGAPAKNERERHVPAGHGRAKE
jgi:hypothetical protein